MKASTQFGRAARTLLSAAFLTGLSSPGRAVAGLPRRVLMSAGILCSGLVGAQPWPEGTAGAANDDPPLYRVEVIVFRHADGISDRRPAPGPADFTDELDPLLVASAFRAARRHLGALARFLPVAEVPGTPDETTPFLEAEGQTLRPIPPVYSALGDLSAPLQRAMTRLIAAPAYEPVVARTWLQRALPRQATARVRVHGLDPVATLETASDAGLVPVPPVLPFGPLAETPPPARAIYRLDGTLRLRQRQFLHLDLDLVWQTRARSTPEVETDPVASGAGAGMDNGSGPGERSRGEDAPGAGRRADGEWQMHRLQQSRVVRPGRMEYFDSSLFGVLARIERFELVVPEIEDEEAAAGRPDTAADTRDDATPSGRAVTEPGG